jgi:hypothetical protein
MTSTQRRAGKDLPSSDIEQTMHMVKIFHKIIYWRIFFFSLGI